MATSWELYSVSVPPDLQRDTSSRQLRPLTPVTIYTGKVSQIFQGILDMVKVDTETQRPKASSWFPRHGAGI